jgi:hypothetical protein
MTPQQQSTVFIPKPQGARKARSSAKSSFLWMIPEMLLVLLLISAIGSMGYVYLLQQRQAVLQDSLEKIPSQIDAAFLDELETFDTRLQAASNLLNRHIIISPVFRVLQDRTLQKVRYDEMSLTNSGPQQPMGIVLNGQAESYATIANQSDIFANDSMIQSHLFSDFALAEDGRISFRLEINLQPEAVLYLQNLAQADGQTKDVAGLDFLNNL